VALDLADTETAPIQPSMPVPDSIRPASSAPPAGVPRRGARRSLLMWGALGLVSVVIGVAIAALVVSEDRPVASATAGPSAIASSAPAVAAAAAPAAPLVSGAAPEAPPAPSAPATPGASASAPPPEASPAASAPAAPEALDTSGEGTVKTPTCEEMVGPSWSLLSSDQPTRAMAEIRLGRRALMIGRVDDAQISFCRAAVLDPTRPDAFLSLVRVLLQKRDAAQAQQWAERAAKQHPDNIDVQGLYGDALARAGDADRARSIWLEMAKIDPSDGAQVRGMAYTYVHLADRAVKGADHAQADRLYRRAVLLDPLNATAASGLARVLLVMNETQAALQWAKRAVTLEPRDAELHVMLGDVQEKLGDLPAAHAEWRSAYDIDPSNFRAASRVLRIGAK